MKEKQDKSFLWLVEWGNDLTNKFDTRLSELSEKIDQSLKLTTKHEVNIENMQSQLNELCNEIKTKETKGNVWKFLSVLGVLGMIMSGYFLNRVNVLEEKVEKLGSSVQNIESMLKYNYDIIK